MSEDLEFRFDATLRGKWQQTDAGWSFDLPEGWMQGRSVFGGLTTAVAAALGHRHVDPDRVLRTVCVNLLRPTTGGSVDGQCRVLREGKSTSFVQVTLLQDGAETALVNLLFARPRPGSMHLPGPTSTVEGDPTALTDLPYIPGLTPEFVKNVHMRWASGGHPFSGHKEARFTGFCGFKAPGGDAEGLIGLLDLWPSPSLSLLSTPVPSSTVTWTAHLLEVPDRLAPWYPFEYETVAGQDGFHTIVGRLFHPDGRLIGWTEQLAALFD